jgi:hypothetical protein
MIVFGHRSYPLDPSTFAERFLDRLDGLRAVPARDDLVDLFVDFGEAYAAVADDLNPERDDDREEIAAWSATMQRIAEAFCAHRHGQVRAANAAIAAIAAGGDALRAAAHAAPEVRARTAEGFAYYALYPEQYAIAAQRFAEDMKPRALVCIGLRGIGAPLAHLVAAEASRHGAVCHVATVRPRGHPFDRHIETTEHLRKRLREPRGSHIAIVDEGPGLSGSSFAAGVELAAALGAPPDRIVVFPSWRPNAASLRSERGRVAFTRYPAYVAAFEEVYPPTDWIDLSAGQWRRIVYGPDRRDWPAVQPHHERRKYRSPDGRRVKRFAGLGRYGRQAFARGQLLADFTARPVALDHGFLTQPWLDGTPLVPTAIEPELLETMASYLATVRASFRTGQRAEVDDLAEMAVQNAGDCIAAAIDAMRSVAAALDEPAVAIDGRMLPHEWLRVNGRYFKTDALDHHADDFLPGARDIAFDVAGAIAEFQLNAAASSRFVSAYRRLADDATIEERLTFYLPAYLAYRLGYARMAAEAVDDPDERARFTRLEARYRRSLEALESTAARAPRC